LRGIGVHLHVIILPGHTGIYLGMMTTESIAVNSEGSAVLATRLPLNPTLYAWRNADLIGKWETVYGNAILVRTIYIFSILYNIRVVNYVKDKRKLLVKCTFHCI
jgi:hypothetical protein